MMTREARFVVFVLTLPIMKVFVVYYCPSLVVVKKRGLSVPTEFI